MNNKGFEIHLAENFPLNDYVFSKRYYKIYSCSHYYLSKCMKKNAFRKKYK